MLYAGACAPVSLARGTRKHGPDWVKWVFGIFYLMSFLLDCKTTVEKRFVLMALYLVDSFITMHDFHHPNPLSEELPIWSVLHGGRP